MAAPPAYKAFHPLGAAPVITKGDLTLAESKLKAGNLSLLSLRPQNRPTCSRDGRQRLVLAGYPA